MRRNFALFITAAMMVFVAAMSARTAGAVEADDFLGKLEGQWTYEASPGAPHSLKGKRLSWPVTIEVTAAGGKLMVVYSEGNCQELRISARRYPPCEGMVSSGGELSFPFASPSGREFTISVKRLPDGNFEARGRIWGPSSLYTTASLRRVSR